MELLKDKIALVTGGSRGIGKRTATLFAEEGATVIFTDLQENDSSRETLAELQKHSPRSMPPTTSRPSRLPSRCRKSSDASTCW